MLSGITGVSSKLNKRGVFQNFCPFPACNKSFGKKTGIASYLFRMTNNRMGYIGIDKKQNGIIYFKYLITIINGHISGHQAYFIKVTSAMGK